MIEVLKLQHIIFLLQIERRGHTVTLKDVHAPALKDWDMPYIRKKGTCPVIITHKDGGNNPQ